MGKWNRIIALLLLLVLLTGCSAAGEIAGNVWDAAVEELKIQLQATLEKNKVAVLQVKSAFGKLNDEGGKLQLFCAFLVRSETPQHVQTATEALGKIFGQAGFAPQTGTAVESPHLVHKQLAFDADKLTDSTNCYLVYVYIPEFALDLEGATLPKITLPG